MESPKALSLIRRLKEVLPSVAATDDTIRNELLREVRELMLALETPSHAIFRIAALNVRYVLMKLRTSRRRKC